MSVHSIDHLAHLQTFTWIVPFSVLIASLIGSLHCVTMCGPLALVYAGDRTRLIAYQLGRMISYTSVGAIAGAFGNGVVGSTQIPWLTELSLIFIALTLIYMGVRTVSGKGFHLRLPRPLERLSQFFWMKLRMSRLPKSLTSGLAGVLTVFLPCGHLYGFIVGAIATGHAWSGALFMFAFWLGTVPALGFGARWLSRLFRPGFQKAPRLAGALLITAGLFSVLTFATRVHSSAMPEPSHSSSASEGSSDSHSPRHLSPKALRCH